MRNHKLVVSIQRDLSAQFISDIFDTAFEGGINYWCSKADTTYEGEVIASAILTDAEDEEVKIPTLTQALAVEAIGKIIDGSYACRSDIRESILNAVLEYDGGYIDSEGADCIVQFAVFKELVYC